MNDDELLADLHRERRERVRPMTFQPNRDYPDLLDLSVVITENVSTSIMMNIHEVNALRRLCEQELLGGGGRDLLVSAIVAKLLDQRFPVGAEAIVSQVLDTLDAVLSDAERGR